MATEFNPIKNPADEGETVASEAGGVWRLSTGTVLRASYGEGFKAPTLYQLFSEFGNARLGPERAKGWEAGVEQKLLDDKLSFGATYYERKTKGQIIFASCTSPSTDPLCVVPGTTTARFGYYLNVSQAEAHGIETSTREIAENLVHDPTLLDDDKQINIGRMMTKIEFMTRDRGLIGSFLLDGQGHELAKSAALNYSAALKPSASDFIDARDACRPSSSVRAQLTRRRRAFARS